MEKIKNFILSILLFVAIPVVAQETLTGTIPVSTQDQKIVKPTITTEDGILNQRVFTLQPGSKLWLDGTSTLYDYKSTSNKIIAEMKSDFDKFVDIITNKNSAKLSIKIIIPVNSLKSDDEDLDDNLYETLNEEEYKNIVYELTTYKSTALPDSGKNWYLLNAIGELTIAGVKKDIDLKVAAYYTADSTIHFKGSKLLNMEDYNIDPPSFMFGVLKTDKYVTVSYDLIFK